MGLYYAIDNKTYVFSPSGEYEYNYDLSFYGKTKTRTIILSILTGGKKRTIKFIYPETINFLPIADIISLLGQRARKIHVPQIYNYSSNMTINTICNILTTHKNLSVEISKGYCIPPICDDIDKTYLYFKMLKYNSNDYLLQKIYLRELYGYELDEDVSILLQNTLHLKCPPKRIWNIYTYKYTKEELGHIDWKTGMVLYPDLHDAVVCEVSIHDYIMSSFDCRFPHLYTVICDIVSFVEERNRFTHKRISKPLLDSLKAKTKKYLKNMDDDTSEQYRLIIVQFFSEFLIKKFYKINKEWNRI